jgi:hypothetical protein
MQKKYIHEFKAGDLVKAHGGIFRITKDAYPSRSHHTLDQTGGQFRYLPEAPSCACAPSVCVKGEFAGYFSVGTEWGFQGNFKAGKYTLADESELTA